MKSVYHELTMLYMNNSINLSDLKEPDQYMETYLKTYNEIRSKYQDLSPKKDPSTSRPKGSKIISGGI